MADRTIRVRIAVAVNTDGKWQATGGHDMEDDGAAWCSRDAIGDLAPIVWVEADIEIPEGQAEGTVVDA